MAIMHRPSALELAREIVIEQTRVRLAMPEMPEGLRQTAERVLGLASDDLLNLNEVAGLDAPPPDLDMDRKRLEALATWSRWAEGYLDLLRAILREAGVDSAAAPD